MILCYSKTFLVPNIFSLRSCRSSSANFFWFFAGKFGKLCGKFGGNFPGYFLTHRTKAQKFRGKFRSIFRKRIRGSKRIFRAKFTLQTCHLNNIPFRSSRRPLLGFADCISSCKTRKQGKLLPSQHKGGTKLGRREKTPHPQDEILDGQNRQSPSGLKSQLFLQFCCIRMFKTYSQSRVSNRSFKLQGRQRFESRVFKSLAILDLDRAISPI